MQEKIVQQGMDVGGSAFDLGDGTVEDGGEALLSVEDGEGFVVPQVATTQVDETQNQRQPLSLFNFSFSKIAAMSIP
ncbi:MAG: hypothetical protein GTN71_13140 [Anaerolineae bacterium]|nr:hypothetical protein [Anaerolineae bacterium]